MELRTWLHYLLTKKWHMTNDMAHDCYHAFRAAYPSLPGGMLWGTSTTIRDFTCWGRHLELFLGLQ